MKSLLRVLFAIAVILSFARVSSATTIPIGYTVWDLGIPPSTGTFDIVNVTGINSSVFPDMTFPVTTSVNLSGLSLLVDFSNGSSTTFGSSYFTLAADGLSFNGSAIPIGGANPLPTEATLTGTFSPLSLTLNNGSTDHILSSFSATILPSSGRTLSAGDFALIVATTTAVTPAPVPEPATVTLTALGLVGVVQRYRHRRASR